MRTHPAPEHAAATGAATSGSPARRRLRQTRPWLLGLAAIATWYLVASTSDYLASVLVYVAIYAILASSVGLVVGLTGQVTLGHAAFFAVGAYTSGILTAAYGWPSLAAAALGAALSAGLGYLVGAAVFRLSGYYFAMATLALSVVTTTVLISAGGVTGGGTGLGGIPRLSVFGAVVRTTGDALLLAGVVTALILTCNRAIHRSPMGRALFAVHQDEAMASAVGVDTARAKRRVFTLATAQAALAGSLYAHHLRFLAPADFDVLESVQILVMALIGGATTPFGPAFGAALITALPELVATLQDYELVVTGVLMVLAVAFLPEGLVGLARRLRARAPGGGR